MKSKWTLSFKRAYGRKYRKYYYKKFKKQIIAYAMQWNKNNPDKHKASMEKWKKKNKQKILAYARAYYKQHPETYRKYRKKNRLTFLMYEQMRHYYDRDVQQ